MIDTTRDAELYAVFGPGWGFHYLAPDQGLGSGHLAYKGPSLREARRVLAERRRAIARMRKLPHLRYAGDTYALYRLAEDGRWTPENVP